jgi:uncharacterized protein YjiS (DUF1127 family)
MNRHTANLSRNCRPASKTHGWLDLARNAVGRALAMVRWRYQACRTPELPAVFNDRMLADIGLTRGQIGYEARNVSLNRISQVMWIEGRHPGDSRNPTD